MPVKDLRTRKLNKIKFADFVDFGMILYYLESRYKTEFCHMAFIINPRRNIPS